MDITILMPCLNEEETLASCIKNAKQWIAGHPEWDSEVVIADNGSTDSSLDIAKQLGARVINVSEKGMGAALLEGSKQAYGKWIIMGDSDNSYDFSELDGFVSKLNEGYDLVVGNRFKGGIENGAMPTLNRYLGNPVLTLIGKIFFHTPINDFHCGLRGITKESFLKLDLHSKGMEYYTEMAIRASLLKMRICEVPTTLAKDGRSRPPHLKPWRDGWRNLRFMLLYAPEWLFYVTAFLLFLLGLSMFSAVLALPFIATGLFGLGTGLIIRQIGVRQNRFISSSILNFLAKNAEILSVVSFILLVSSIALIFFSSNSLITSYLITIFGSCFYTFCGLLFFSLPKR